jgi:hypothetical protein
MQDDRVSELDRLAREARAAHQDAENAFETAKRSIETYRERAARCGGVLNKARPLCRHGKWLPWLATTGIPETTARRYMGFAERAKSAKVEDLKIVDVLPPAPKPPKSRQKPEEETAEDLVASFLRGEDALEPPGEDPEPETATRPWVDDLWMVVDYYRHHKLEPHPADVPREVQARVHDLGQALVSLGKRVLGTLTAQQKAFSDENQTEMDVAA